MGSENKQISMAASAIALRGVRIFLTAGRAAADRKPVPTQPQLPKPKPKPKAPVIGARPPQKVFDMLFRTTRFNKAELEALYSMYRRLIIEAQSVASTSAIGQPPKMDMRVLILLASIALASARTLDQRCDGIVVKGINHDKEIIKENVHQAYQMAIDFDTNILYFSYSSGDKDVFGLGYLNLKTNDFGRITGVAGSFANTVDEQAHNVYFGGNNGIYRLNNDKKTATMLDITDKNIWQLFYKDGLYFTTYPDEEAYLYKGGKVSKVTKIGNTHAILISVDNAHNIFFSNASGLYLYTRNDGKTTFVGDYTLNGFTSDVSGKLYFSTPTGIFEIIEETKEVKKLAGINNIYGAVIESDGSIIYSTEDSIVRLKSTGKECLINKVQYE